MENGEAVLYTQVVLKITIVNPENLPTEFRPEVEEWLKYKAVQLGIGHHNEHCCVDDDFRNDIQVDFIVEIAKKI